MLYPFADAKMPGSLRIKIKTHTVYKKTASRNKTRGDYRSLLVIYRELHEVVSASCRYPPAKSLKNPGSNDRFPVFLTFIRSE